MHRDDRPVPRRILVAGVLAIGALSATTFLDSGRLGALLPLDVAVAVVSTAAVVLLLRPRLDPAPAVALALLAAVSPAATPAATLATLRIARTRPLPTAVAVAGIGTAAHVVRYAWRPVDGLPFGWWVALAVVVHAALLGWGAFARSRAALLESLRERAHRAEAEQERRVGEARLLERTRIAREMHDVLAHRLSLVAAYAGALEYRPDSSPERISAAAGVVRVGVHQALDELREVIGVLRADPAGPTDRPQPTAADLAPLVAEVRAAGVAVTLDDRTAELPDSTARTVYRVVQEGLTNARRHAAGQPVHVELSGGAGQDVVVEIRNPLLPAALPGLLPAGSGTGLIGLAERVQLAGGRLEHGPVEGEFRLRAALPRQVQP